MAVGKTRAAAAAACLAFAAGTMAQVKPEQQLPEVTVRPAPLPPSPYGPDEGYDRGAWRYALNIQNLTDKVYVSTCLGRGDCWWGSRRTAIASACYRF